MGYVWDEIGVKTVPWSKALGAARGETVLTLVDDLRNPPEEISLFVAHLLEINLDVVYGVREQNEQKFLHGRSGIVIRRLLWKELQAHSTQDLSQF